MATINKTDKLDENEIISLFRRNLTDGERIGERCGHERIKKMEENIRNSVKEINNGDYSEKYI